METLETPRLIIRPFTMEDLEEAHQMLDVNIQWVGAGFTRQRRKQRLQFYIDLAHWQDTGCLYGYRAIVGKAGGELIGLTGFHPDQWTPNWKAMFWPQLYPEIDPQTLDHNSLELEIGYALSEPYRGQGYAAEAVRTLIDHALNELQFERLFAVTDRDNAASISLMRRVGMRVARNPNSHTVYPGAAGVIERF